MSVIAVSIEFGALDSRFEKSLAQALGLRVIDQRQFEIDVAERGDTDDGTVRHFVGGRTYGGTWAISPAQLALRMKEQVLQEAAVGNVLFLGASAPLVLTAFAPALRIHITAPMALRECNVMRKRAYAHAGTARLDIDSMDGLIARFVRRAFDLEWSDESLYDIVLDGQSLSPKTCIDCVKLIARLPRFQETPSFRSALEDELDAMSRHEMAD